MADLAAWSVSASPGDLTRFVVISLAAAWVAETTGECSLSLGKLLDLGVLVLAGVRTRWTWAANSLAKV